MSKFDKKIYIGNSFTHPFFFSVNMGRSEVPHEVSFSDGNTLTIRKKVGYVLAFLAIAGKFSFCEMVGDIST